jgi:hypothetical protein
VAEPLAVAARLRGYAALLTGAISTLKTLQQGSTRAIREANSNASKGLRRPDPVGCRPACVSLTRLFGTRRQVRRQAAKPDTPEAGAADF